MFLGINNNELDKNLKILVFLVIKYGFRLSDRFYICLWDN